MNSSTTQESVLFSVSAPAPAYSPTVAVAPSPNLSSTVAVAPTPNLSSTDATLSSSRSSILPAGFSRETSERAIYGFMRLMRFHPHGVNRPWHRIWSGTLLLLLVIPWIPYHLAAQQYTYHSLHQNDHSQVVSNERLDRYASVHSFEVELLGLSMPYSFGYTYQLRDPWALRIGVGYFDIKSGETNPEILEKYGESFIKATNVPVTASYFLGSSAHRLELRGGLNFIYFSSSTLFDFSPNDAGWSASPVAGASYMYLGTKFLASAGLSFHFTTWTADSNVLLFPGIRWGVRL